MQDESFKKCSLYYQIKITDALISKSLILQLVKMELMLNTFYTLIYYILDKN